MIYYVCPNCYYEIPEREYKKIENNYLCPRCKTKRVCDFRIRNREGKNFNGTFYNKEERTSMALSVTKKFTFAAAHHLPNHIGKCKQNHGHNWNVFITLTGEMNDDLQSHEYGMIIDFAELKKIVNTYLDLNFDHKDLNTWIYNPTAENITFIIFEGLSTLLNNKARQVTKVDVYESPDSCVTWAKDFYVF